MIRHTCIDQLKVAKVKGHSGIDVHYASGVFMCVIATPFMLRCTFAETAIMLYGEEADNPKVGKVKSLQGLFC